MSLETLLSQVKKLRKAGPSAWLACCPAHEDRSPSMKITQASDGRVLIHCFAGCTTLDILGAVGMTIDELFEEPLYHKAKPLKGTNIYPRDVLRLLITEFMIVLLSSYELKKGNRLSETDQARLELSYERFMNALELAEVE